MQDRIFFKFVYRHGFNYTGYNYGNSVHRDQNFGCRLSGLQHHSQQPRTSSGIKRINYWEGRKGIPSIQSLLKFYVSQNPLVYAPHAKGLHHMIIEGGIHNGRLGKCRLHHKVHKLSSSNYTKTLRLLRSASNYIYSVLCDPISITLYNYMCKTAMCIIYI